MFTNTIKAIIIDDEIEACDNLLNILSEYIDSNITVVGIANDTIRAERLINELKPDVVFLDIEMPDENAFQFLERISPVDFEIVFVTAYDEFAIRAFRLNALDYILKPIDIDELATTIIKLEERVFYKGVVKNNDNPSDVLRQITNKEQPTKLAIRSLNHLEVVDFSDISYIEGQGSYCKISFVKSGENKSLTTSNVIAYYESLLPPQLFYRIHKSYLANCHQIAEIIINGTYSLYLKNKEKIPISRRRYNDFIGFLKENSFYGA
ncbi:MAG: yehT 1 [Flavipsychrobacter sp.]|jgi:two-component system LytT family response regulator|nr:yehT 1 [Flavipsychrobacter sp.]